MLDIGREARPGDLGGGVAVGALPGDDHELGSAFVHDIDSGALRTIELSHGIGVAPRVATDGHLVVGTRALTNGDMQAAWVYHLDSGRLDRLDFLEGRTRGGIADVSGSRMAGTFGADDDEKAWLYDIDTGVETPLHPLFGGALSWVNDIDGDLVVGGTQTPKPWTNQAIVYDVASGPSSTCASKLGGESKAWAVDGPIVGRGLVVGRLRVRPPIRRGPPAARRRLGAGCQRRPRRGLCGWRGRRLGHRVVAVGEPPEEGRVQWW